MQRGAEVLVRVCAGVKPDEHVVIVTDADRIPIALAVADAVRDADGSPVHIQHR